MSTIMWGVPTEREGQQQGSIERGENIDKCKYNFRNSHEYIDISFQSSHFHHRINVFYSSWLGGE